MSTMPCTAGVRLLGVFLISSDGRGLSPAARAFVLIYHIQLGLDWTRLGRLEAPRGLDGTPPVQSCESDVVLLRR